LRIAYLATVRIIEFIFIGLVIVAVAITSVVALRWVNDVYMDQGAPTEGGEQAGGPQTESLEAGDARFAITDAQIVAPSPLDHPALTAMKDYAPLILPITWGAVAGAVIWRGKVRSQWSRQGYDYDTFRLVAKMRGSATRQKLLETIRNDRKNKLQLANELGLDWKTVDNHVDMLLNARLIVEDGMEGTARFYTITENGRRVLLLLEQGESP
jgi:predicted transcriptional regulator